MATGKAVFLLQTDPYRPKPVLRALREAESLARGGWTVSFVSWIKEVAPSKPDVDPFVTRRVLAPVPPLATAFIGRARAYLRASRLLRDAVLAESPDLIVAHDFEVLSAAVAARRRTKVPVIYDSHEDWPAMIAENSRLEAQIARIQETRLCRAVGHVVTVSDPIAAKFRAMRTPVTVLYNARPSTEVVLAEREESRRRFGYEPEDFVIGFAGALAQGRGLELLLEALPSVAAQSKALIVGGPDSEGQILREHAENLGVLDRCRFDGYRPFKELGPYYASMDVGVILLDRRPNHERALPNKLFDYMAHGVPVFVPAYPAMSAVVRDSNCGTTVEVVDANHIAARMRELAARREDLEALGSRGREAYRSRYCWERQETTFLGIVDRLPRGRA